MSHPVLRTAAYRKARKIVLARDTECQVRRKGCTRWSTEADHIPPIRVLLDRLGDTPEFRVAACDPLNMRGACAHCNRGAGGALARARARMRTAQRPSAPSRRSRDW